MNITKTNIDDVNAVVTLTVEKADYAERVERILKDYRKKANVPGFRPGKVPASMINKMYGKAVLLDEVNKIMSEELTNYLTTSDFQVLGDPLPSDEQQTIDFDSQEDFEFKFDIGLAPVIDITLSKKDKIKYYEIAVDEDVINKQIDHIASRYGEQKPVDSAEEKDLIRGNFTELDAQGNALEGGIVAESVVVSPERVQDKKVKKALLGEVKGKTVVMNVKKSFENDTDIASMLSIEKEKVADLTSDFSFTVTEIMHFEKAELNQDLFDKVYGEGAVATEEEFKNKISEELKINFASNSDYKFSVDAKEKITSKIKDAVLPETFLKRWITLSNKENDKVTPEQIEEEFPLFLDDLRWNMAKGDIAKKLDIKLEEADVLNYAKNVARSQFAQYGMNNVPDQYIENYAREMINNKEQSRGISEKAFELKVLEAVKEVVKLDVEKVTMDEFNKLFK